MTKYAHHLQPGRDYQPIQEEEVIKTAVYKITIETWTGKQQSHDSEYFEVYDFIPPGKA